MGPNVRPELGMKIKDRQALIELVRKSVHRAMANEAPLHLSGRAVERRGDGAAERTSERATEQPSDRENEPVDNRSSERPTTERMKERASEETGHQPWAFGVFCGDP